jgi:hypothetical protein
MKPVKVTWYSFEHDLSHTIRKVPEFDNTIFSKIPVQAYVPIPTSDVEGHLSLPKLRPFSGPNTIVGNWPCFPVLTIHERSRISRPVPSGRTTISLYRVFVLSVIL